MGYMLDSFKPGQKLADTLFRKPVEKETLEDFVTAGKRASADPAHTTAFTFPDGPRSSIDQRQSMQAPGTAPYAFGAVGTGAGQRQSMPGPPTYKSIGSAQANAAEIAL